MSLIIESTEEELKWSFINSRLGSYLDTHPFVVTATFRDNDLDKPWIQHDMHFYGNSQDTKDFRSPLHLKKLKVILLVESLQEALSAFNEFKCSHYFYLQHAFNKFVLLENNVTEEYLRVSSYIINCLMKGDEFEVEGEKFEVRKFTRYNIVQRIYIMNWLAMSNVMFMTFEPQNYNSKEFTLKFSTTKEEKRQNDRNGVKSFYLYELVKNG